MPARIASWFGLVTVVFVGLFGVGWYLTLITVLLSFLVGVITVLYFKYDKSKVFSVDIDSLDDPLQQVNFSADLHKVLDLFQKETKPQKFDSRITGSETVDFYLNEIITIIINDFVNPWYEVITNDDVLTTYSIRRMVVAAGANISNRIKSVDWIHLLSTKFPEELTSHLKLFKQSRVRLKQVSLVVKEVAGNGKLSPKREERKTHRRNKSDTDVPWVPDVSTYGKSKFYSSNENLTGKTLQDLFFELECSLENKEICRDIFCSDPEKEYALISEVSEAVLYLVAPEEVWGCHALKLILIEFMSAIVLKPLIDLLSDPDLINRTIIKVCCRDLSLSSELFLMVIRSSNDAEELDATLEMVQKDIQKLHSKDSAGEWDIQDRQKLSSLQYLTRVIQARRATIGPDNGSANNENVEKMSEEVTRSQKFIKVINAWTTNAQYLLEIEMNESDSNQASKEVLENLRSTALEICDLYLAPNSPTLLGVPEGCHAELVRKITTEGEDFSNNPLACFDELQKCIEDALEDDPSWQANYLMDGELETMPENDNGEFKNDRKYSVPVKCKKLVKKYLNKLPNMFSKKQNYETDFPNRSSTFPRSFNRQITCKNHTLPKCKTSGDSLPVPGIPPRHNRSRSEIVGNFAQSMLSEATPLSANAGSLSLSHSEIREKAAPLTASIIETALRQEKGKAFGIYAIAVTRLSDKEMWHIYRRYSDFYDLHCSVKERWPELSQLPFPAKKTFQNTSRSVLESRKRLLNAYLHNLVSLAREARYTELLGQAYLGGFLSSESQEKQSNTIDAVLVNSLRAGMKTLKNMPDQLVNTVDGVMDGISKVFQGKSGENFDDVLKNSNSSDGQDEDESAALRLLEEVLGIRGLWLRRRLLAPVRTLIADRVNKKVLELVISLTSQRSIVQYLKSFKQWLQTGRHQTYGNRDQATKARARVAAKVGLLSACSDDIRHIAGLDTARRSLLAVHDMLQTPDINRRLIYVLLEAILIDLFPDNNIQQLFRRLYANSPRVPPAKKTANNQYIVYETPFAAELKNGP